MTGASVHGLGRGLRLFGGDPFAVSRIFATFIDESKTPLQMKRLFLLFFCFLFAGAVHAADYRFERDILYRTDAAAHFNFGVFSDFFDHFTNERRIYGLTRLGTVQIHDMDALGTQICPLTSLINGVFVIDRNVVFQIALTQTYATPFLQIDCRN